MTKEASSALRSNGIKQLLRRLRKKTGLPKVHAHRFRHSFATWAIENGARELDVQLLLGVHRHVLTNDGASRLLHTMWQQSSNAESSTSANHETANQK